MVRVIALVGIMDLPGSGARLWDGFADAFADSLPEHEWTVMHRFYLPWQFSRMQRYAKDVRAHIDTDDLRPVVLIGYSLGGVIARAVAPTCVSGVVRLVVTMQAPHAWAHRFGFHYAPWPGRTLTVAGAHDRVVPAEAADLTGNARKVVLPIGHYVALVREKRVQRHIASLVREEYAGT